MNDVQMFWSLCAECKEFLSQMRSEGWSHHTYDRPIPLDQKQGKNPFSLDKIMEFWFANYSAASVKQNVTIKPFILGFLFYTMKQKAFHFLQMAKASIGNEKWRKCCTISSLELDKRSHSWWVHANGMQKNYTLLEETNQSTVFWLWDGGHEWVNILR